MKDHKNQALTGGSRPVVIYDGACGFCRRWVARLRRRDVHGSLELVPFQDLSVAARFPGIPRGAFESALHLFAPDGTVREGAAAIEGILATLPSGRWLAVLFRLPFARPLAERVYRFVARNRRRDACREHGGEGHTPEGP